MDTGVCDAPVLEDLREDPVEQLLIGVIPIVVNIHLRRSARVIVLGVILIVPVDIKQHPRLRVRMRSLRI